MRQPVLILAALAWLVASPDPGAAEASLLGQWEIVDAAPAPWVAEDQRAAAAARGKRLLKTLIVFKAKEVTSKVKGLGCRRAEYQASEYPLDALFRGALPEPNQERVALNMGFKRGGDVPSVDLRCTTGQFTYHFRDPKTLLYAFDNVIYTLQRH